MLLVGNVRSVSSKRQIRACSRSRRAGDSTEFVSQDLIGNAWCVTATGARVRREGHPSPARSLAAFDYFGMETRSSAATRARRSRCADAIIMS